MSTTWRPLLRVSQVSAITFVRQEVCQREQRTHLQSTNISDLRYHKCGLLVNILNLVPVLFLCLAQNGGYIQDPMELLPSIWVWYRSDLSTNSPSKVWRWVFFSKPEETLFSPPSLDRIPPLLVKNTNVSKLLGWYSPNHGPIGIW